MRNKTIRLIGWLLFVVSAVGFIIAGMDDVWTLFGSLMFLFACLVFLVEHFRQE